MEPTAYLYLSFPVWDSYSIIQTICSSSLHLFLCCRGHCCHYFHNFSGAGTTISFISATLPTYPLYRTYSVVFILSNIWHIHLTCTDTVAIITVWHNVATNFKSQPPPFPSSPPWFLHTHPTSAVTILLYFYCNCFLPSVQHHDVPRHQIYCHHIQAHTSIYFFPCYWHFIYPFNDGSMSSMPSQSTSDTFMVCRYCRHYLWSTAVTIVVMTLSHLHAHVSTDLFIVSVITPPSTFYLYCCYH